MWKELPGEDAPDTQYAAFWNKTAPAALVSQDACENLCCRIEFEQQYATAAKQCKTLDDVLIYPSVVEQLSKIANAPNGTQTQVGLVGDFGGGASVSSSGPGTPQKQALSETKGL